MVSMDKTDAFDVVLSFFVIERARFAELGIDSDEQADDISADDLTRLCGQGIALHVEICTDPIEHETVGDTIRRLLGPFDYKRWYVAAHAVRYGSKLILLDLDRIIKEMP